jgi:uncharacterized protein YdeI (YjbR/CyaY-like superfamily)
MPQVEAVYFASPDEFRAWLEANHATERELLVGFHRKGTGKPSMTWPEAVDQALCFGWIDSVRRRVDDERYTNRFTPRKPGSTWSAVNIKRVEELIELGLMQPAGLAAFEQRREDRARQYAYEQPGGPSLTEEYEAAFKAHETAWSFFQAQSPSYRRTVSWWVISAKREETRRRRLATLIAESSEGRRLDQFARVCKDQQA